MIAADSVFLARELGESIQYAPKGNRSAAVSITAILMREPIAKIEGVAASTFNALVSRLFIPNDDTIGLTAKPDAGGDEVSFAEHVGGAVEWRKLGKLISEDGGGWLYRCR